MKLFSKVVTVALLAMILSACATQNRETRRMTLRQSIGNAYGINYFNSIEQIQYEFNARIGDKQVRRFWIWEPKLDRVTFKGTNYQKAVTYNRRDIETTTSSALKKVDAWFINDNYWLLFPFHVVWDANIKLDDLGRQNPPMKGGKSRHVKITFPPSGGYTPGDIYEIYLDDNYRLIQWVYRKGGAAEPTRTTTWEAHRQVGPLVLSLDHKGDSEEFRVWFTSVGVKLMGSDSWMFTQ